MTTIQLLIVCVTAIVIVALFVGATPKAMSPIEEIDPFRGLEVGQRVAVFSEDGSGVRGVVASLNGNLTLHDAAYLREGHEQPLLGAVRVARRGVAFVQELSNGG